MFGTSFVGGVLGDVHPVLYAIVSVLQDLSPFQKNQTFPNGDELYPSDRPTLQGMHLEVNRV